MLNQDEVSDFTIKRIESVCFLKTRYETGEIRVGHTGILYKC